MPTPKSRHKNKLLSNGSGLKDPPISVAHIAFLLNISPRKEAMLWAVKKGPPCWFLGGRRVSTVSAVEDWIAEQTQRANQEALANFGKKRPSRRHSPNSNRRSAA